VVHRVYATRLEWLDFPITRPSRAKKNRWTTVAIGVLPVCRAGTSLDSDRKLS
jgi:hypothetical protein